jgi:hypothetical protein
MEIGFTTPLQRTPEDEAQIEWMLDGHCVQPSESHDLNVFKPCRAFSLDHFSYQPLGFESMDALKDRSPINDSRIETETHYDSPIVNPSCQPDDLSFASLPTSSEKYIPIYFLYVL